MARWLEERRIPTAAVRQSSHQTAHKSLSDLCGVEATPQLEFRLVLQVTCLKFGQLKGTFRGWNCGPPVFLCPARECSGKNWVSTRLPPEAGRTPLRIQSWQRRFVWVLERLRPQPGLVFGFLTRDTSSRMFWMLHPPLQNPCSSPSKLWRVLATFGTPKWIPRRISAQVLGLGGGTPDSHLT